MNHLSTKQMNNLGCLDKNVCFLNCMSSVFHILSVYWHHKDICCITISIQCTTTEQQKKEGSKTDNSDSRLR